MRMTKLFKTVKLTTISNCIGWYFANDTDILYILDDFDVHESHRISRKYHKPEIWRKFHRNSRKMLLLDFYWIFICLVWLILMISFCFWFLEFHDAYSMIPGSMISYAVRFCNLQIWSLYSSPNIHVRLEEYHKTMVTIYNSHYRGYCTVATAVRVGVRVRRQTIYRTCPSIFPVRNPSPLQSVSLRRDRFRPVQVATTGQTQNS